MLLLTVNIVSNEEKYDLYENCKEILLLFPFFLCQIDTNDFSIGQAWDRIPWIKMIDSCESWDAKYGARLSFLLLMLIQTVDTSINCLMISNKF